MNKSNINQLVQKGFHTANINLENNKTTALGSVGGGILIKKLQKKSQAKSPIKYKSGRRSSY